MPPPPVMMNLSRCSCVEDYHGKQAQAPQRCLSGRRTSYVPTPVALGQLYPILQPDPYYALTKAHMENKSYHSKPPYQTQYIEKRSRSQTRGESKSRSRSQSRDIRRSSRSESRNENLPPSRSQSQPRDEKPRVHFAEADVVFEFNKTSPPVSRRPSISKDTKTINETDITTHVALPGLKIKSAPQPVIEAPPVPEKDWPGSIKAKKTKNINPAEPAYVELPGLKPIPTPVAPTCSLASVATTGVPPSSAPTLHELLSSFPSGLWDMRRHASPLYDARYESRYAEPAFPHDKRRKSIRLLFTPCRRTEFSWGLTVKAKGGARLIVADVLRAISTDLFRRSSCLNLYEGHPCFRKAESARRLRTKRGLTDIAYPDDPVRNVDLYHVDRGQVLYFRGLKEEKLRDGEIVYFVKFSYA